MVRAGWLNCGCSVCSASVLLRLLLLLRRRHYKGRNLLSAQPLGPLALLAHSTGSGVPTPYAVLCSPCWAAPHVAHQPAQDLRLSSPALPELLLCLCWSSSFHLLPAAPA